MFRVHFHYERRMEHFLFVLIDFFNSLRAQALSEAKKSMKETKHTQFHARSEKKNRNA